MRKFLSFFVPAVLVVVAGSWVERRIIQGLSFVGVMLAATFVGAVIYHIEHIGELVVSWGKVGKFALKIRAKAEEIEAIERELKLAVRSFVDGFFSYLRVRHIFPLPAAATERIIAQLNILAVYAVPNPEERGKWLDEIKEHTKEGN